MTFLGAVAKLNAEMTSNLKATGAAAISSASNLEKLFVGLYGEMPSQQEAVPDARVAAVLCGGNPLTQDLTVHARAALSGLKLAPRQLGLIKTATAIVGDFFNQPALHPQLSEKLIQHSGALIGEALMPSSWLTHKSHPVVAFLSELSEFALGWYPTHPQASDIADMLGRTLDGLQGESLNESIEIFRQWRVNFDSRVEKVSARVIQGESGTLRAQYARGLAARTINRQVAGRNLPVFMVRALVDVWQPAFQWVLLDEGDKGPLWPRLVKNFGLLVWSLQADAAEQKTKLHRVIDQLKQDFPDLLSKVINDELQRKQVLEDIEVVHLCMLHGQPVEYQATPALEGSATLDILDAEVSADLLQEVSAIQPSQWFVLPEKEIRIRLLQRVDEYQQLLFVNQLGMKALTCSYEEFAFQYSSGHVAAVTELLAIYDWSLAKLQALANQYRSKMKARAEEAQNEENAKKIEAEKRETARLRAVQDAERLQGQSLAARSELEAPPLAEPVADSVSEKAIEKKIAAATESAQDVEQARRAAVTQEYGSTPEQRRQRARLVVSGIFVGAWVSFHDGDGKESKRKLAVILPSSNKYIFVDRVGADKLQLTRTELIEGVAEGAINMLQKDARFDDALARVVGDLQRHR